MRRAAAATASLTGWLLVGVPLAVMVATLPASVVLVLFGLGLFLFPVLAAGIALVRGGRALRRGERSIGTVVAGLAVGVAMAALLSHAPTWDGELKHAWFFWPMMGYAVVTGVLGAASATLAAAAGGEGGRPSRAVAVAVVVLLVLGVGSAFSVAAG